MGHVLRHISAKERGTIVIKISLYDEDRKVTIPKSLTWSLFHLDKTVVNSREEVEVVPNEIMAIVLYGDDLAITPEYGNERVLLLKGIYQSDLLLDLPLNETIIIDIENLFGIEELEEGD